jgi:hypothetical protein
MERHLGLKGAKWGQGWRLEENEENGGMIAQFRLTRSRPRIPPGWPDFPARPLWTAMETG